MIKRVGIDDMALYVPHNFLPIKTLADKRSIEFQKLKVGLGLENTAFSAPDENAATMAAEAILELMKKNNLKAELHK